MRQLALIYTGIIASIIAMADAQSLPTVLALLREVPFFDKVCHFVLIGGLALMANLAFDGRTWGLLGRRVPRGSVVVAVVITAEEFSQMLLPHRSFSWTDMAANWLGILIIGGLAARWLAWRQREGKSAAPSVAALPRRAA